MDAAAFQFFGNTLTLCFVWGLFQFHRHDYRAPWLAYTAVLFPLGFLAISVLLTEPLPPHLDAIAPLLSSARSP